MKYLFSIILILFTVIFAACGLPEENKTEQTIPPVPSPEQTISTPSPTPPPDFSNTDFTGRWNVTGVIAPDGNPLNESEFSQLDTDFYVEILKDGVYLVYDIDGQVLGQGKYSVSTNILTLSAGGMETVYVILDENTLHCLSADDSVTVMTRSHTLENENDETTDANDVDTSEEQET